MASHTSMQFDSMSVLSGKVGSKLKSQTSMDASGAHSPSSSCDMAVLVLPVLFGMTCACLRPTCVCLRSFSFQGLARITERRWFNWTCLVGACCLPLSKCAVARRTLLIFVAVTVSSFEFDD